MFAVWIHIYRNFVKTVDLFFCDFCISVAPFVGILLLKRQNLHNKINIRKVVELHCISCCLTLDTEIQQSTMHYFFLKKVRKYNVFIDVQNRVMLRVLSNWVFWFSYSYEHLCLIWWTDKDLRENQYASYDFILL